MDHASQSIVVVYSDGSTQEFDRSFFAVASQDNVGALATAQCDMGFTIAGTALLCAYALRSAFKEKDMSRVDSFFFTVGFIRDWLRALIVAMKEVEVPHE